jgi:hypothetical protein
MGRGLSQLQRDILDVLGGFPSYEQALARPGTRRMASTGRVIDALGRDRTNANYAAISKALHRLVERDLVVPFVAQCALPGKGRRYAKR